MEKKFLDGLYEWKKEKTNCKGFKLKKRWKDKKFLNEDEDKINVCKFKWREKQKVEWWRNEKIKKTEEGLNKK